MVRFSCNSGYRLVGYEVRRCRDDGLWSWGVEAECMPELNYKLQIGIIYVSVLLPILLVMALLIYFAVVFYNRRTKEKSSTEKLYLNHEEYDHLQSKVGSTTESPAPSDGGSVDEPVKPNETTKQVETAEEDKTKDGIFV